MKIIAKEPVSICILQKYQLLNSNIFQNLKIVTFSVVFFTDVIFLKKVFAIQIYYKLFYAEILLRKLIFQNFFYNFLQFKSFKLYSISISSEIVLNVHEQFQMETIIWKAYMLS